MEHRKLNVVRRDDSIFAGAIFMSNRETKLECLQRKLFGLPLSKSKFLKQVKVGMILFLFEHEERKLYGVFEATSDGALNIIPDAFRSTGQSYPAQILFKRIWMCKPLCEDEFCSAIEENYYSPNKFHFGLSYKQVIKLIHLFYSRKINIKQHKGHGIPNQIIEKFENTVADEVRLTETGAYFKCKSDEYSREGKKEVRLGPNQVNLSSCFHPQNSYTETLSSQRCSICLSHDHIAFHHFSIEKEPLTTSEIEYKPLPLQSSCYMSGLDNMAAPCLMNVNHHSSRYTVASELPCNGPSMIPRMVMIQEEDTLTSLHITNHLSPQTEIFPDYIPLVEESQQKLVSRENQNSSLENSEYTPSAILHSCIPSSCKEISKHFASADGYSDDDDNDELKTYQRVEADEYYNAVKSQLYADYDLSRTSVFSRLSRHQNIRNQEFQPSNGEPSTGLSLSQLLDILSTRRNSWSAREVSKQSMERNNNELSNGHQNKITQIPIQPVERGKFDQYEAIPDPEHVGSDLSNDVLSGESFELPFYNFRRRNTNQRYEFQDDSNKSGDICDSEAKLMKSKRRRIVRPSLYEEMHQNMKAEAEVKISAQKKERTDMESKKGRKVSAIDRFLIKYEAVGESLEQNYVTSVDESLDYIPIG